MNEPMYKYFKPGIIHFMAFPSTSKGEGPIEETVRKIACDEYFSAIEVAWIKDPEVRSKVRKIVETSHMTLAYGAHPMTLTTGININDLDDSKRSEALNCMFKGIDEAYELGAVGFAFLSGKYEEETKEQSFAALVDSTKQMCGYAKSKGDMKIVLEIFDFDIDKKSIIGPAPLAKRLAEEISKCYENFGLIVDLSHIPLLHESCEEAIMPIKDYIVHAHMGNAVIKDQSCTAYGDTHPRFGFPDSENDVAELTEYLRVLMKAGFFNEESPPILSFEVKPWEDEDPELVIANAKRTLNEAWARL